MFGEILEAVGSIFGAKQQQRADRRTMQAQEASIARSLDLINAGETRATDFLRQALQAAELGRQRALSQTAQAEFQGYRALQDQLRGGESRLGQNLASRGLFGTSVAGAGRRSLFADYGRAVGQLGSQLGGMRSQIEMNAAGSQAAGLSNLGQLSMGAAQARAGIQSNVQYQGPQELAENYGMMGAALGSAIDGWGAWSKKRQSNTTGGPAGLYSSLFSTRRHDSRGGR